MACSSASTTASSEEEKKEQRLIDAMFLCDEWKSSKGGLSTFNRELAIHLAETTSGSMNIHCYVSRSDDHDREEAEQHGVNLITAQTVPGSRDPLDWLKVPPPELRNPHIVIGHGRKLGTPACHIARVTRCKWIQFVHVFCEDLGKFKESTATAVTDTIEENEERHKMEIELCKAADAVVAVGSRLQQKYSRSLPNVEVEIITPGIVEKFCNESVESREHPGVLLRTLNTFKSYMFMKTFNVFMFGRATFEDLTLKGYDIVANAIGSLGEEFELTFVGSSPGDHRNVEQWFLQKTCIKRKQITIRGYCTEQDELKEMFHQSDLVALPSRTEGFGLVGLEAISCGVPILVSGESGVAEALQNVEGGNTVIVGSDEDEWARRISEVSSQSPEERQANARQLRENYRKVYSWKAECERFNRLIENVVKTANGGEMNIKVDVNYLKPEEQNIQTGMLATETVRCHEVQQPTASATSPASGSVSYPKTDLQAHRVETFLSIIKGSFHSVELHSIGECNQFKEYAKEMKLIIVGASDGSLVITVKCESLMILEDLWTDYSSGHLGEVVQNCFVTEKILKELNLAELRLKATMDIEEYNACKMFFEKDALRDALSSEFHSTSSTSENPQKKKQWEKSEQKTKIMETVELEGASSSEFHSISSTSESPQNQGELKKGKQKTKIVEREKMKDTSPLTVKSTTGHGKELIGKAQGRKGMLPLLRSSKSRDVEELHMKLQIMKVTRSQYKMKRGSKPMLVKRRSESVLDVVQDLELLCVKEEVTDMRRAKELREKRVAELRKSNGTLEMGYKGILDDIKQTLDRRRVLEEYYLKVKDNLQTTGAVSETEINDFRKEAEACLKDLGTERYTVLILGETSAGKSSLINLLLGECIMPTSIQQNTLTICEISYGEAKKAVLHFANGRKSPRVLTGDKFYKYKDYVKKPIEDENWCEWIEIRIPNPLLKGGVVIVDSPGIGDSKRVSEITLKYLSRAYAFIYVINTPNAGGLQQDRLMPILSEWKKLYKGKDCRGITSESAIFVCNKWDEVEKLSNRNQKEDLERQIIDTLRKNIPELDEKFQIIKMSVSRATEVKERFEVMDDDLKSLVNRLQRLLSLCIERKTEFFYYWISGQLCSLSDQLKGEMQNAKRTKDERLKARKELDDKLSELKQGTPIREIEDAITSSVDQAQIKLASYLQTEEFRTKFFRWTEDDVPKTEEGQNFSKMKEAFTACIEQRFEYTLQKWESTDNFFSQAHLELEALFDKGFLEFEREIRDIDRVLVGSDVDGFQPFEIRPGRMFSPLDPRMKKFLVMTGVIFWPVLMSVGLAAGVLSAPVLGVLAIGKHLKDHHLKTNCCQTLKDLSAEFLEDFITHKIRSYVQDKFSEETNRIASIKRCHQQLITKYEQRCKDLTKSEDESREKEILNKYRPLYTNLMSMNENLMFDAIQNGIKVMYPSCQLEVRRLQYNESEREACLGEGSFGKVLKGRYSPPGHRRKDVAVKKIRKHPDPSNVAAFLKEAAMLKQLEHKHIVTFYGVGMDVKERQLVSLVLVFDLCSRSLDKQIFENDEYIPWKTASAAAKIVPWAKQILDALEFIHSKNVVHRDLKLANILISKRGHIKVADLGLATFKDKITGTVCGTPLYMAPEVMEGKLHSAKVDIYSFGLMMWEMWFGKRVFIELRREDIYSRIKDEHYRPQIPKDGNLPPAEWIELMTSSWQSDPSLRRTATECKNFIKTIKHQYVK